MKKGTEVIVRTYSAGVHFGKLRWLRPERDERVYAGKDTRQTDVGKKLPASHFSLLPSTAVPPEER